MILRFEIVKYSLLIVYPIISFDIDCPLLNWISQHATALSNCHLIRVSATPEKPFSSMILSSHCILITDSTPGMNEYANCP